MLSRLAAGPYEPTPVGVFRAVQRPAYGDEVQRQLVGAQERQGPGWKLTVGSFEEQDYAAPALPPKGQFYSKGGPVDVRVFRKSDPNEPVPHRH